MRSRKDIEQEKDEGSSKVFDMVERLYGRGRYLGKKRKFEKHRGVDQRV